MQDLNIQSFDYPDLGSLRYTMLKHSLDQLRGDGEEELSGIWTLRNMMWMYKWNMVKHLYIYIYNRYVYNDLMWYLFVSYEYGIDMILQCYSWWCGMMWLQSYAIPNSRFPNFPEEWKEKTPGLPESHPILSISDSGDYLRWLNQVNGLGRIRRIRMPCGLLALDGLCDASVWLGTDSIIFACVDDYDWLCLL